jgi:calcineurin-like phosphoesterase family protein
MKTWITSDHHFGHKNILNFKLDDGSKLRDFPSYEDMEAFMVDQWNSRIAPDDKVYHLGDFSMTKKHIEVASRLNGRKTLILGNHDIFDTKEYLPFFKNVRAYRVLKNKEGRNVILSHIPIHPSSRGRFALNIHGHTHAGNVTKGKWWFKKTDPFYFNACVEKHNYLPIDFNDF